MFNSIEEGLVQADKLGIRLEIMSKAKEIQKKRHPMSMLDAIEAAFVELNKAPK